MKRLGLFCLFLALLLFLGTFVQGQPNQRGTGEDTAKYGYYYKGKLISLTPSNTLVAISEKGVAFKAFTRDAGFIRDPLSERKPLKERRLGLYRLPASKGKTEKQVDLQTQIKKFAEEREEEIQPVFEQGQALLIPGDEIIVGFKATVNLNQARAFMEPHTKELGIVEVRDHRKNAFILKISKPSNGRVYEICRSLSTLNGVHFAEPNHIIIFLRESRPPFQEGDDIHKKILAPEKTLKTGSGAPVIPSPLRQEHSSVSWEVLIDEGFEGATLPAGWSAGTGQISGTTVTDAYWSITDYRSRSGTRSLYATGGGTAGVPPPGDYPNDCNSRLKTPVLNLAAYEEVYVEFWYYAKFGSGLDLGGVIPRGSTPETTCILGFLLAALPDDPTTANGWRRALLRVPPKSRIDGVTLEFVFASDENATAEGLYVDRFGSSPQKRRNRPHRQRHLRCEAVRAEEFGANRRSWQRQ
jgi:hypothetical protein